MKPGRDRNGTAADFNNARALKRPKSAVAISLAFFVLRLVGRPERAAAVAAVQTFERK
jgi:hypothetical protein